jgi:hypothetical protein
LDDAPKPLSLFGSDAGFATQALDIAVVCPGGNLAGIDDFLPLIP